MKKNEKKFDSVKYMRNQREILSTKLSKMSNEEIIEYFRLRKSFAKVKPKA